MAGFKTCCFPYFSLVNYQRYAFIVSNRFLEGSFLEIIFQHFSWKFKNETSGRTRIIEKTIVFISMLVSAGLDGVVTTVWGGSEKRFLLYLFFAYFKETSVFIISIVILGASCFYHLFEVFLDVSFVHLSFSRNSCCHGSYVDKFVFRFSHLSICQLFPFSQFPRIFLCTICWLIWAPFWFPSGSLLAHFSGEPPLSLAKSVYVCLINRKGCVA